MSLPVRQEFDDSIILNKSMKIYYTGSLTDRFSQMLKKRRNWPIDGDRFVIGKSGSYPKLDLEFSDDDSSVGNSYMEIKRENDGFYFAATKDTYSFIYITDSPYF